MQCIACPLLAKRIDTAAKLGFFHIVAQIPTDVRIAPFPFRSRFGMIFYPYGTFETYVTLPELLAVRSLNTNNKIGFKIVEGYQFIPSNDKDDSRYIFKDFIIDRYRKRQQLKLEKSPLERTIKLILNSMSRKGVPGRVLSKSLSNYNFCIISAALNSRANFMSCKQNM